MQLSGFIMGLGLEMATRPISTMSASGSSATLSIAAIRGSDQVAPEGIWFEATPAGFDVSLPAAGNIYDATFHDILYVWSFSDAGPFTAPVKIPTGWDDKNVGYGRHVSHVFAGPGTYSVTCTAIDRTGNSVTTNLSITVQDPATQWPNTRTICVALDGVFTGAPTGSDNYTTMAAAEAAYKALGSTGRMLLKRGATYTFADNRIRNTYPNFHLGSFGTGAPPKLADKLWISDMAAAKDATLWGIDFALGWDSTTETGTNTDAIVFDTGRHVTVLNVAINGAQKGIYLQGAVLDGIFCFQNVNISNWRDYGTLLSPTGPTRVGWKGCAIHQHVDALGSGVTTGTNNKHGPMRWSGDANTRLYLGCVDLFSNNGRTNANGVPHHQPCLRTASGHNGMFLNIERISCEGGIHQLALSDTAASGQTLATNIVVDKAILVGSYATQHNVLRGLGATTIRNFTMIQPNAPSGPINNWRSFIAYKDQQDDANNRTEPVKTYSGTFANLLNDNNDPNPNAAPWFRLYIGGFAFDAAAVSEANNIGHMPNSAALPDTADTPLDIAELWTARSKGMQYAGFALDTSYAPPAGTVALYAATTGSAAKGDATSGVVAIDDIDGNTRPATPSRGPLD